MLNAFEYFHLIKESTPMSKKIRFAVAALIAGGAVLAPAATANAAQTPGGGSGNRQSYCSYHYYIGSPAWNKCMGRIPGKVVV